MQLQVSRGQGLGFEGLGFRIDGSEYRVQSVRFTV